FLAAEFDLLGIPVTGLPGLCALQTCRTHLEHADYRFDSLCRALTCQWTVAERYALEVARLPAAMVARLDDTAPKPLSSGRPVAPVPPMLECGGAIAPRAAIPRGGTLDLVDLLVDRLPAMQDAPPPRADGLANYRMAVERYAAQGTVTAEDA